MVQQPRSITDTELQVLKAVWAHGPATVRDLIGKLGTGAPQWAYTTLLTLLRRLQDKGYVSASKHGRAHVYEAAIEQDELLREHLDELADRVCEGEAMPLVLNLFQGRKFSREEITHFRALLDELEDPQSND